MADFIPLARPLIGAEECSAVERVLRSGKLTQGPEVEAFEGEFSAALVDGRRCVAVSSGTSGAHLGLLAAGIGLGDEVIVPSFTFAATANAVALTGATPVFVDIEPDTFNVNPAAVEAAVTPRTAGIMPVHLYGHPADMDEIVVIASKHGLAIFEDAAQAHGAAIGDRHVGTYGAFAMFSLYPTKNMTSGEGGMDACSDPEIERRLRLLRNQGMDRPYENELIGFNARMTDVHAAIGRQQLQKLPGWTRQRRENAAFFDQSLEGVAVPPARPDVTHVYHQYTVRIAQNRDQVAKALADDHGIGTGVYYPTPTHRLPSYGLSLDLPETTRAAAEVLSLPIHPTLTANELDRIVSAVNQTVKAFS